MFPVKFWLALGNADLLQPFLLAEGLTPNLLLRLRRLAAEGILVIKKPVPSSWAGVAVAKLMLFCIVGLFVVYSFIITRSWSLVNPFGTGWSSLSTVPYTRRDPIITQ